MSDIHGQSHIREVKAVTEPNKRQGNDMVPNELPEIFSGLLQLKNEHNSLLCPVTGL